MQKPLLTLLLALAPVFFGINALAAQGPGLDGSTILIIRHAEKPAAKSGGPGLTPAGEIRAKSYVNYFTHFQLNGAPLHIDTLVATADTHGSMRPRLTLTPLSQATTMPIQQPFGDDDVRGLAEWLGKGVPDRTILIAWHHGMIPSLLAALGADPNPLIPGGKWPPDTYDWVIALRYSKDGKLLSSQRIAEPAGLVAN